MTTVKKVCGAEIEILPLDVELEEIVADAELYSNELEAELPSGVSLLEVPIQDWDNWVNAYGRGYSPAPPSPTTSVDTDGDSAWQELNIYTDEVRKSQVLKAKNILIGRKTLAYDNEFGNTNQFTNSLGGSVYDGSDGSLIGYSIDHITGYGWYDGGLSSTDWYDDLADALGTDFGGSNATLGFTDWFMGSSQQFETLLELGVWVAFASAPTISGNYVTSTTYPLNSDRAYVIYNSPSFATENKTTINATRRIGYCRKHF